MDIKINCEATLHSLLYTNLITVFAWRGVAVKHGTWRTVSAFWQRIKSL